MGLHKLADRQEDLDPLRVGEAAVSPARNGQELVRHADLVERRVQTNRVVVWHDPVFIAMVRRRNVCKLKKAES